MRHRILSKRGTKLTNLNRRKAIRHHCLACSDYNWSGVKYCGIDDCSLHKFRFGTVNGNGLTPDDRDQAIKKYCSVCLMASHDEEDECDANLCALFPYRSNNKNNVLINCEQTNR